ncbi:MAG: site-2 protease family protein [Candidatus Pristimantibacillus sp.]
MSWESLFRFPVEDLPFVFLAFVIGFTVHEFAHAYSAYKFGDKTAYDAGRVTLNPRVHIDWLGAILILIAGFGWAKPVPVNQSRFKYPRLMGVVVSAVGPLSNLVIGVFGIFLLYFLVSTGLLYAGSAGVNLAIEHFLGYLVSINFMLFVFNLIPLPPLDGYRIIQDLAPLKVRYKMEQNVQWGVFFFLAIVFIPPLRRVTLDPIMSLQIPLMDFFATIFQRLF